MELQERVEQYQNRYDALLSSIEHLESELSDKLTLSKTGFDDYPNLLADAKQATSNEFSAIEKQIAEYIAKVNDVDQLTLTAVTMRMTKLVASPVVHWRAMLSGDDIDKLALFIIMQNPARYSLENKIPAITDLSSDDQLTVAEHIGIDVKPFKKAREQETVVKYLHGLNF